MARRWAAVRSIWGRRLHGQHSSPLPRRPLEGPDLEQRFFEGKRRSFAVKAREPPGREPFRQGAAKSFRGSSVRGPVVNGKRFEGRIGSPDKTGGQLRTFARLIRTSSPCAVGIEQLGDDLLRRGRGQPAVRRRHHRRIVLCGGFLGALRDPSTAAALGAMHHRAEAPWTVASLAKEVGLSRSVFAARFTQLVGEPPLGYLTRLRMQKRRHCCARAQRSRRPRS